MQFAWNLQTFKTFDTRHVILASTAVLLSVGLYGVTLASSSPVSGHLSVAAGDNSFVSIPDIPNTGAPIVASATKQLLSPMLSFDFDNGFASAYGALPRFDAAGFDTEQNIVRANLGGLGYVNSSQIVSMQKRGHEMGTSADRALLPASVFVVHSETTFAGLKKAIDDAADGNQWLVLVFHRVDESKTRDGINISHELLQKTIDYVKARGIRVVTHSEGLRIAGSAAASTTP